MNVKIRIEVEQVYYNWKFAAFRVVVFVFYFYQNKYYKPVYFYTIATNEEKRKNII